MLKMDLLLCIYITSSILYLSGTLGQVMTGCTIEYHSDECYYSVNCTVNLDFTTSFPYFDSTNCRWTSYYNGRYYAPTHLTYRRIYSDDEHRINWNSFYNYFPIEALVTVDLSQNQYKIQPSLPSMPNLKALNMSNNLLAVAKLSNEKTYNNLVNIDFSFNKITFIEVEHLKNIYQNLEILDLSHNIIDNIPDTVFDLYPKLEHLNLSFNRLTILNILSFVSLKNLKVLLLDDNDIIDINSSLLRLRNLQELSLSHNSLERISKHDFEKLISLQKLDISSNKIMEIEKNSFDNMTYLSELDLSENALTVIDQDTFKNTINLFKIDLSGNKLRCLPKELFKGRTISFSIENNILEGELVNGMFYGLNNTISLDIANQYITSIEDYAFTGLDKLELLLLNNNKITKLSKNSFKSLVNVRRLDISDNYIVDIDFEKSDLVHMQTFYLQNNVINKLNEGTFQYLNHLQLLDLSHNNISYVANATFENLINLTTFEVRNNPFVSALNSKIFNGLTHLPNLDISHSKINILKNNTFYSMEKLKYLNLSHNLVAELQFNTFVSTGNIATVDLSHNRLTYFLVNTTDLQNLGTLLINNNLITKIFMNTFRGLSGLLKLNLSYNNLTILNDKALLDQKSLLYLDLSFNSLLSFKFTPLTLQNLQNLKISGTTTDLSSTYFNNSQLIELEICYTRLNKLTNTSFNNFEHLESLVINNNKISTINNDTFYKIVYLQSLDLSYNHIEFIQSGSFKNNHKLKSLDLSHNLLVAFSYGALRGLISLDVLDISFNHIINLQKEVLFEAENLKTLIADNNDINDINYVELNDINLSELSIGDNPISCKRIYQLNISVRFKLTSLIKIDHKDNIYGIKCLKEDTIYKEEKFPKENNDTDRVLSILRKIFINSSSEKSDEHSDSIIRVSLSKIADLIQKSNSEVVKQLQLLTDATLSVKSDNQTHTLLERLLRVLVKMNSAMKPPLPTPSGNVSLNDLTSYVSEIKKNLENDIMIQKESVLAEVDSKISLAIARGKHIENLADKSLQDNSKFIEISVGLLLSMSFVFLIYKTYKWCKHRTAGSSISFSRRHITDSLENSNL